MLDSLFGNDILPEDALLLLYLCVILTHLYTVEQPLLAFALSMVYHPLHASKVLSFVVYFKLLGHPVSNVCSSFYVHAVQRGLG